jgi:siroheme synthase-like protein
VNTLYPIFLKLDQLQLLIVGGGKVATEKLHFILKNSPDAKITVVAQQISAELKNIIQSNHHVILKEKIFDKNDIIGFQLIIAATNLPSVNKEIYEAAKAKNILVNIADTPQLCDFYLSSIVSKGELKIGISTNGKSPVIAKRLREFFEQIIPDNINDLILNMHHYRTQLKGNLEQKVKRLNEITKGFSF